MRTFICSQNRHRRPNPAIGIGIAIATAIAIPIPIPILSAMVMAMSTYNRTDEWLGTVELRCLYAGPEREIGYLVLCSLWADCAVS